ncbi:hypothetical protein PROFUN_10888 [Planoprotostelium fungivorum]|uniref:Uncharacterized protein n=1 Tax=Planoprotostelium fungivorum TaxID=1890364 RepID=A0A2P6NC39_9EUKA|nr:hypothetical protein PROFUN_10888 [Planoprotostelium fungivorum]
MRISWRKQRRREFIVLCEETFIFKRTHKQTTTTCPRKVIELPPPLLLVSLTSATGATMRLVQQIGGNCPARRYETSRRHDPETQYHPAVVVIQCILVCLYDHFATFLHKASTECTNTYKCFAEDYQTEHRSKKTSANSPALTPWQADTKRNAEHTSMFLADDNRNISICYLSLFSLFVRITSTGD